MIYRAAALVALLTAAAPVPAKAPPPPAPTCTGADDCTVKWGRALQWVMARNPTLRQQTDSIIKTELSLGQMHEYQVTRIPLGQDRFVIDLQIWCANTLWGCKRDDEKRAFAAALDASAPQ